MTQLQNEQLADLVGRFFEIVANSESRSEHLNSVVLIDYWIRKQIWQRVLPVMQEVDPSAASSYSTEQVELGMRGPTSMKRILAGNLMFLLHQESHKADSRVDDWVKFVRFVDELIEDQVRIRTSEYIIVIGTKKKN